LGSKKSQKTIVGVVYPQYYVVESWQSLPDSRAKIANNNSEYYVLC